VIDPNAERTERTERTEPRTPRPWVERIGLAIVAAILATLFGGVAAASWLGKWIGPEGTFLELTGEDGAYRLTIQSLDGPATYDAVAVDDRIEFQRNGAMETIRATSGAETGMKWLLDKKDCLTIKTGEGFCRD